MKPNVFIGSSVEGLSVAYALQESLEYDAIVTVWNQGLFDLSGYVLDELIDKLDEFDFGIFVFQPDDILKIRSSEVNTVRDNVIFELGLFIGKIGRKRNFIILPKDSEDLHLPSDLLGLIPAKFDTNRVDKNIVAALGPASSQIRRSINKLGPLIRATS